CLVSRLRLSFHTCNRPDHAETDTGGVPAGRRRQGEGQMKRSIIPALAATLVLGTTMAADAVRQDRLAEDAQVIEQAWTAWALGGSSNALLADDFCGEIVEGKFFLTVPLGSGATELDCTIPSGMQAVASPFGAFSWAPTDGKTGTKLFNATFGYLKGVEPKAVKVVVDGSALPRGPMLCSPP